MRKLLFATALPINELERELKLEELSLLFRLFAMIQGKKLQFFLYQTGSGQ